jgi:CheY-like chemotaxis protein
VRQTSHLKRLVDDLLDIARVTRGSLKIDRRRIDLREVLDAALEAVRSLFAPRQRKLDVITPGEPVFVFGDAVRLTQVVTNLLSNAAKFTAPGGRVVLTVSADSQVVRIVVQDDGRGIEAEVLSTIFDPFVRAAETGGEASGGLGLGLALVNRVVALHDGEVNVSSPGRGQGTRFVVELPRGESGARERDAVAAPSGRDRPSGPGRGDTMRLQVASVDEAFAPAADRRAPAPSASDVGSEVARIHRVLVCDDNADAAEMIALLVETRGHEVAVSITGTEALARAESFQPSFVLLDIGLPDMSGYDVARQLRRLPTLRDTVIVAVTGYGQAADREAALQAGCDLHLVKPVTGDRLFEALRTRRVQVD